MHIRAGDFVGRAEGIKKNELSTNERIEILKNSIVEKLDSKRRIENQIDYFESELLAAYEDVDENGEPDYGRIASIEFRINELQNDLYNVEQQLAYEHDEMNRFAKKLEDIKEEKEQTLFEIQERARNKSQNIYNASGMQGAWASMGSSLQDSFQTSLSLLNQAAAILDGTIDGANVKRGMDESRSSHISISNSPLSAIIAKTDVLNFNETDKEMNLSNKGNRGCYSTQHSSRLEVQFAGSKGIDNSFLAELRKSVVSDEEAAMNENSDSNTSSSYNDEVSEQILSEPTFEREEHAILNNIINDITKKIFCGFKEPNDSFIEVDNGKAYYEEPGMREQIINLVNDGLPINPPYANKSSSDDNEDNEMSNEPGIDFSRKKIIDDDRQERVGIFNNINRSSFDISTVKGLEVKLLKKDGYDITVVKDRFIPQIDVKPLLGTKQQIRIVQYVEDGSKAKIFDHPEELQNKLSYEQGVNERGMRGTCGLANLGVWLQIAGSSFREKDVVNCAATNIKADGEFLCSKEGGTLPEWRKQVWSMFGVDANVHRRGKEPDGELIERLAAAVESGRAVSVGLNAGKLWSQNNYENYNYRSGKDNAFGDGGSNHVVGVVSCVRDFDTGEITHLYINDTGRGLKRDACRKVPIEDFKKAFCVERASVCISQYAIW